MKSLVKAFLLVGMLAVAAPSFAMEAKNVQFKFTSADPVVFSHQVHLPKVNNKCKVCHNAIFNLKKKQRVSMAAMEKGSSCGACHNGTKAFSVATEKYCSSCHKGRVRSVSFKAKGATDVAFSHDLHLAKTDDKCKACHNGKTIVAGQRGVTMAKMEKGATCGACHNGKKAFTVAGNCDTCHKGFKPRDVVFKNDGGEVKFSHEFHLGIYKCADCHTKVFPYKAGAKKATMADMEKGSSCGACHGKDAFSVTGDCDKCHKM
jgi:c(7)-type cytochrome triheme protein